MTVIKFLISSMLFTCSMLAFSWNESGHRQVAYIAYDLVSEQTKAKVTHLIQSHPRYAADFVNEMPKHYANWSKRDQERWVFSQIAVWPDFVRGLKDPAERQKYFRMKWHFINLPVFPNAELESAYKGAIPANLQAWTDRLGENRNILQILHYLKKHFKSGDSSLAKSIQLCWLFHLVGDIHQPMHSVSLFTPIKFHQGDRGGNLVEVGKTTLHSTWDSGAGNRTQPKVLRKQSRKFINDPGYAALGEIAAQTLDFELWLGESYMLANSVAYGAMINDYQTVADAAAAFEGGDKKEFRVTLSKHYKSSVKQICKKRIVEAGYRLAALLESDNYF